jgi:hypothetical protein
MAVAVAQEVKAELRRLVLARTDLEWAARLFDSAAKESDPDRSWSLWEVAVNAYGRPFKGATLTLRGEWSTFEDPDLAHTHRELLKFRDKLFAHNDRSRHRRVVVIPPDGAREVREAGIFVSSRKTVAPKKLVNHQLLRIERRVTELVHALCLAQGWEEGREISLEDIDDKLELQTLPSPFQTPPGVTGAKGSRP